ncbi:UDP-N-acetylmuramoyl-L-alanine--D-glutamate ligase [Helcococcus kunzii]|uniref:UDP-N-acetylmuramoylalanine--D-glutamate ligase n=1 Tax=Helcococcus kunzii ATCC 51366 TaxID=883114 RepID=H3NNK9_9FIRM|nr:UDP-N-acetylmuramoyl-L-alanine--D-glutamate ligase [Helcococcus kunzii]EHR33984.1 UDP-N-acetylmuramoylalanine-D-glutamate ligase [Helcococcus kunzii ATCC 51366]MCT1795592.1 UDP-N-acetylmuramoyl-L-alanine--D-glutamate ligase [Helcococcus kunzii]MCT1989300.1 UDP-N-acetylmuramoyl-L-alanine--D-glutamate ligase [Helcococcus kunzii]QZO77276.1 UDP-N-acetylmuramoyl-L-alanine--D-glutamate ligase [Helcococcus kunzii]
MEVKDKKIIVFGLGVTGKSSIKALYELGAKISIYDDRKYEEYKNSITELEDYISEIIEDYSQLNWSEYYCVLKSPGIRLDNKFVVEANKKGVEVISDIELAYRIWGGDNFVAVTGTNGKTTTTSLISHILNYCGIKSKVVGNIGIGILYEILKNGLDTIYALEMSSFQLSNVEQFKPKIAVFTNITPDHTDWHGSFENYFDAKKNIYKNFKDEDTLVLNKDDKLLSKLKINANTKYFSLIEKADAYLDGDEIVIGNDTFNKNILNLVGKHNIANTLAALLAIQQFDLEFNKVIEAIKDFQSIEHRIEFVEEINGVKYYNDSKGTNIDSTKVALSGFENNVILIAGGYDKKVDFDELFEQVDNIKLLILFGDTKYKIHDAAVKMGVNNINIVDNLEKAVHISKENSSKGDTVLFSPACASWDMYDNYEQRGNHFKSLVRN